MGAIAHETRKRIDRKGSNGVRSMLCKWCLSAKLVAKGYITEAEGLVVFQKVLSQWGGCSTFLLKIPFTPERRCNQHLWCLGVDNIHVQAVECTPWRFACRYKTWTSFSKWKVIKTRNVRKQLKEGGVRSAGNAVHLKNLVPQILKPFHLVLTAFAPNLLTLGCAYRWTECQIQQCLSDRECLEIYFWNREGQYFPTIVGYVSRYTTLHTVKFLAIIFFYSWSWKCTEGFISARVHCDLPDVLVLL